MLKNPDRPNIGTRYDVEFLLTKIRQTASNGKCAQGVQKQHNRHPGSLQMSARSSKNKKNNRQNSLYPQILHATTYPLLKKSCEP